MFGIYHHSHDILLENLILFHQILKPIKISWQKNIKNELAYVEIALCHTR